MILVDNQGAIKLAANPQFHNCTKHIDIRYHFICDTITVEEIILNYLPMADMVADIMTKLLLWEKQKKYSLGMGLLPAAIKSFQIANGNLEITDKKFFTCHFFANQVNMISMCTLPWDNPLFPTNQWFLGPRV